MSTREEQVDVAVVGGGPAGAAAALTLTGHTDLRVALIERSQFADWRVGESLPPGARGLLGYLGVLDLVTGGPHRSASGTQAAWGGEAIAATDFIFSAHGHGWHLDRARFDAALAARAAERGALLLTGTLARRAERGADGNWRLPLSPAGIGPAAVRARFVIDASGRAAAVARRCGARRRRDDRLVGVLGIVGPDRDAAQVAGTLVEADRDGWWYAAPLGSDRVVLARMTDADLARADGLLDPSVWLARVRRTRHIAARLGSARLAGPLAVRPSFSQRTLPLAGPGWLAAGEAAVAFDPLSGMGIGYALASGIEAARAAAACIAGRDDARAAFARAVGDHYRRYLRRRSATYAIERRWLQSPFWARRQVDAAAAA